MQVKGANGKMCQRVKGSCSCCGAEDNGQDWFVYRAGWCDSDGVYYPRLCGDKNGSGCISKVFPAQSEKNDLTQLLIDLMPNEVDDGILSELEDYDY